MAKYILSDPNFSDGTRPEVIEQIVDEFRNRDGVKLIYEETLIGALDFARVSANEAIRAYRLHGDLYSALEEAGRPLCEPLRLRPICLDT